MFSGVCRPFYRLFRHEELRVAVHLLGARDFDLGHACASRRHVRTLGVDRDMDDRSLWTDMAVGVVAKTVWVHCT